MIDPSNAFPGSDFIIPDVSVTENGVTTLGSLDFYNGSGGGEFVGGFVLSFDNFDNLIIDSFGPQVYSGDEGAPTFLTGTFSLTDFGNTYPGDSSAVSSSGTLTATTDVPEPSTLFLLGVGLAAGLAVSFLRKN